MARTERIDITLAPEDLKLLEELSARTGLSRSAVIREALHRLARAATPRAPANVDIDQWLHEVRALAKKIGPVDAVAEVRRWRETR